MVLQAIYPSTLHRDQEGIYMARVNQSNSSLELEGAVLLLFLVHLNGSIPSVAAAHVLAWLHGRSWTNSPERRGMKLPHFFSSWNRYFPTGGVNCTGGVNDHFPQSELISEGCLTSCFPDGQRSQRSIPHPANPAWCYGWVWIWKWKGCGRAAFLGVLLMVEIQWVTVDIMSAFGIFAALTMHLFLSLGWRLFPSSVFVQITNSSAVDFLMMQQGWWMVEAERCSSAMAVPSV